MVVCEPGQVKTGTYFAGFFIVLNDYEKQIHYDCRIFENKDRTGGGPNRFIYSILWGGGSIRRKILHFFDKYFVFLAVLPYLYGADLNERQISQP